MRQNNMLAMILAGGRGTRLYALTKKIAKPAVYYGGKYRIIDFPLSNCANSNINVVGVLTQYESVLLNSYAAAGQRCHCAASSGKPCGTAPCSGAVVLGCLWRIFRILGIVVRRAPWRTAEKFLFPIVRTKSHKTKGKLIFLCKNHFSL